ELDRRSAELGIMLSRRSLINGSIGVGVAALAGAVVEQGAEAARRGYGGPSVPTGNGAPMWQVVVSLDEAQGAFVYAISQDAAGDPRLVRYSTTWKGVVSFEGAARPLLPLRGPSSSSDRRFDAPGHYD